jgi:hypothetical protein
MFKAICSRRPDKKVITADEAFSQVSRLDDWGCVFVRDGWRCLECGQPVFLKGPHERLKKDHSYHVQAHFCHHSAVAAEQCELYKSGKSRPSSLSDTVFNERLQSLRRFLDTEVSPGGFLEELLLREEEVLLEPSTELGIGRGCSAELLGKMNLQRRPTCFSAADLFKAFTQLDNFQSGVFALGMGQSSELKTGFLAERGRRNCLRRLFVKFGKNRKRYFAMISVEGLERAHDSEARRLIGTCSKGAAACEERDLPPLSSLSRLGSALIEAHAVAPNSLSLDCLQYLYSLPLLGDRLIGFERVVLDAAVLEQEDHLGAASQKVQNSSPSARFTSRGKLVIGSKPLRQFVEERSESDGSTTIVLPGPHLTDNYFVVVPGEGVLLLTSNLHSIHSEGPDLVLLTADMLAKDSELPSMAWKHRLCLIAAHAMNADIVIDRESVLSLLRASGKELGDSFRVKEVALRSTPVPTGLLVFLE